LRGLAKSIAWPTEPRHSRPFGPLQPSVGQMTGRCVSSTRRGPCSATLCGSSVGRFLTILPSRTLGFEALLSSLLRQQPARTNHHLARPFFCKRGRRPRSGAGKQLSLDDPHPHCSAGGPRRRPAATTWPASSPFCTHVVGKSCQAGRSSKLGGQALRSIPNKTFLRSA